MTNDTRWCLLFIIAIIGTIVLVLHIFDRPYYKIKWVKVIKYSLIVITITLARVTLG